ncbi:MAG: energy transducer TonB family protein [Myxococcales bacterium]
MPLPQKPVRRGSRLSTAIAISLIAHALLLPFVARDANFHLPKHPVRQVVSLMSTSPSQIMRRQGGPSSAVSDGQQVPKLPPALVKPPEPEPEKLVPGQVVDLGPTNNLAPDKPTKYLSEHDSKVLKETRARETSAFFKNALSKIQKEGRNEKAPSGAPVFSERPGDNGKQGGGQEQKRARQEMELPSKERRDALRVAEAPDGTLRERAGTEAYRGTGKKIAMADPGAQGKVSNVGPGEAGAAPGAPGELKPLKLTLDQPMGALGPIAGGPMPDDLRGVEEGDETLLNSRSFKYAGFLNRVKETVGRVWVQKVQDEAGKRDPTGQLYSYKDRRTVIEFTLDRQGEITDVKVAASSGVPYLDSVAVDAFRIVQRFPNPPPGLIPEHPGVVSLPFAFTLLAATGGMKMQIGPAYLPGSPAARGF